MALRPRKWTDAETTADISTSKDAFRADRTKAPRDLYLHYAATARVDLADVVPQLSDILGAQPDLDVLAEIIAKPEHRRALLYTAAPPISEDDLKTVAKARLSKKAMLDAKGGDGSRIAAILKSHIDPERFPWIEKSRDATADEIRDAIMATAAMLAAQRVQTIRRNKAKLLEETVKHELITLNYTEVKRKPINTIGDAPPAGTFMGETLVAGHRADVVVRLPDQRLLLVECKVSNSEVNSKKRVVNDAGGKAPSWYSVLGTGNVVVCAVLNGVFKKDHLLHVQDDKDVYIFWAHRLQDMANYIGPNP